MRRPVPQQFAHWSGGSGMRTDGRTVRLRVPILAGLLGLATLGGLLAPVRADDRADSHRDVRRRAGFAPLEHPPDTASSGDREAKPSYTASAHKVFGNDDRYPVLDATRYPWSTVCSIESIFPDGSELFASGVLIGPGEVLTAGHAVHDAAAGGWAESVRVIPAYEFGDEPFGFAFAADLRSFEAWTDRQDAEFDLALVELDEDLGFDTGWLGYADETDATLLSSIVNTAGYPTDLDDGEAMWAAQDFLSDVSDAQLFFRGALDASGGQSGSGMWIRDGDDRYVTGVLTYETDTRNEATRLSGARFAFVDAWAQGHDSPTDLSVRALRSDLGDTATAGAAGIVEVDLDNLGARPAEVRLDVVLVDERDREHDLGSTRLLVLGDDELTVSVGVRVPDRYPDATGRLRARAVIVDDSPELHPDDNELDGDLVSVEASVRFLRLGRKSKDRLFPGEIARYRFEVPDGRRRLKVRLFGRVTGRATVTGPDGTLVELGAGRGNKQRIFDPAGGTWEVAIENDLTFPRRIRFKAKVSRR